MSMLELICLGDFRLLQDGEPVELPASKKTRALLAYLIVTGQPQRRERLCELFWDLPDDPRGALRWSLSKLRRVVNDDDAERLTADRERVVFQPDGMTSDLARIEDALRPPDTSPERLADGVAALQEIYLGGIDLPDLPEFSEWLGGERERIRKLRAGLLGRLIDHPDTAPDLALEYARQWSELRPFSPYAADSLIRAHMRMDREQDARKLIEEYTRRFADAAVAWTPPDLHGHPAPARPRAEPAARISKRPATAVADDQKIHFCKTADGVSIAYASVGAGPPLVKAANWLTHLELDWSAPIWSPLFRNLSQDFTFIRYDERGNGLSDWNVPDISLETFVTDLESVVDAMGLETFPLMGISQGAAVSIEYAARHPGRVSALILFGGYPRGWRIGATPKLIAEREAVMTLTQTGWGQDNPAYRHIFSRTFMPSATAGQLAWFDDFQRQTTSPENAVRFLSAFGDIDVTDRLPEISVPTLVLHSRGDQRIAWEVGRELATTIPDARLVTLESDNHLLLEGEPAATTFVDAVRTFLAAHGG